MYKIAICDNCNQFLENLNREISIVLKELNWEYKIYLYKNGNIFLQESQRNQFDLVFLDLEWLGETGEILSRFSDIGEIKQFISEGGVTIAINVFMLFTGAFILVSINRWMFLGVLLIVALYAVIVLFLK